MFECVHVSEGEKSTCFFSGNNSRPLIVGYFAPKLLNKFLVLRLLQGTRIQKDSTLVFSARIVDQRLCAIDSAPEKVSRPHPVSGKFDAIAWWNYHSEGWIGSTDPNRVGWGAEFKRVIGDFLRVFVLARIARQIETRHSYGLHYILVNKFEVAHAGYLLNDSSQ